MPPPYKAQPGATRHSTISSSNRIASSKPHRKYPPTSSPPPPLSLCSVPWRFLRLESDLSPTTSPIISQDGLRYIQEDALRYNHHASAPPLISSEVRGRRPSPSAILRSQKAALMDPFSENVSEEEEDEEEGEEKEVAPLAEFNPFSDTFALSLTPTHATATSSTPLPPPPPLSSTQPLDITAELQAIADEEERRKRKGLIAADLLSHYANKDVVDEERERTRKRERSKWENTEVKSSHTIGDGGGVMVGGLGLEAEDTAPAIKPEVDENEERVRRLTLGLDEEGQGKSVGDMPDISDFVKMYEDEDEPSYPAMIWKVKERLTQAVDVPQQVLNELHAMEREGERGKARHDSRLPHMKGERRLRLKFNLGEGKDYEEEEDEGQSKRKQKPSTSLPSIHGRYGRQWYLPVKQWRVGEEQKERMEMSRAELEHHTNSNSLDAYHGQEWKEKLQALRHSLPSLYCSQAFKAFLLRSGHSRLPHYLSSVTSLDEKKEEEEEKRAMQAALSSIHHPPSVPSTNRQRRVEGEQHGLPQPVHLVAAMGKRKEEGLVGEEEEGEEVGEEDEEGGDLVDYMREVKLREVSLAGVRLIKERERQQGMEEKEKKKKEREKMRRKGSGGIEEGEEESDEEEDRVNLDEMFDIPDFPSTLT